MLTALLPIRYVDELDNRKVLYTFSVVGNIYACNQEQAGAILVTVYALFVGSELYQKQKVNKYIWGQLFLGILGLIVIFTAPGHIKRSVLYTRFNMPDFIQLDFVDKFIRGFTSTGAYILNGKNIIWLLFTSFLFFSVMAFSKRKLTKIIAIVPFLHSLCFGVFQEYLLPQKIKDLFVYYPEWGYGLPDYRYINALTYSEWKYYLPLFLEILVLGLIVLTIFWSYRKMEGVELFLIFAAGMSSRVIIGFSPTLYGSSSRTFIFLYFSLAIAIVFMFDKLIRIAPKWIKVISTATIVICSVLIYVGSYRSIV